MSEFLTFHFGYKSFVILKEWFIGCSMSRMLELHGYCMSFYLLRMSVAFYGDG